MIQCRSAKLQAGLVVCAAIVFSWSVPGYCAIGQSAVITLVMPPGARATGTAEAFTGLANDVNAEYFNPAGLARSRWRTPGGHFWTARGRLPPVASKHRNFPD